MSLISAVNLKKVYGSGDTAVTARFVPKAG